MKTGMLLGIYLSVGYAMLTVVFAIIAGIGWIASEIFKIGSIDGSLSSYIETGFIVTFGTIVFAIMNIIIFTAGVLTIDALTRRKK